MCVCVCACVFVCVLCVCVCVCCARTHTYTHTHTTTTLHLAVPLFKSGDSECATSPASNITTDCFPFQLHTVAPVASNGWVLTGEVGKFLPVSANRIASVVVKAGGGFEVSVRGAPGEGVRLGAVDFVGGGEVKYFGVTLDKTGTGTIHMT